MIKPKCPKVGTWKVNEANVKGKFAKQKPTFYQPLNKYASQKAVPRDRPLKKRPRSPPHQDWPLSPRGESHKRRGNITTLFPPTKGACYNAMGTTGIGFFLVQHRNMKGFGCSAIRCRTHRFSRGKRVTRDRCSTGWHDQCMTDWDLIDEDISHLHTMQGQITRARARQLDLRVRSNLVNCFSELKLGSMHVLLIRNNGEDQQELGEGQGVKEEEVGRPHQGGVQVQLDFDSTSDSRT
jgi:hypothetical protein